MRRKKMTQYEREKKRQRNLRRGRPKYEIIMTPKGAIRIARLERKERSS